MRMLKIGAVVIWCITRSCLVYSADTSLVSYPVIGKACPDFTLSGMNNYPDKTISLSSLKGHWTILDFWSLGCASCVESFPKINQLQKTFKGKVQFILVGRDDKSIRSVYQSFEKKYHLELPYIFTKEIFQQFKITGVPHVVWIDNNGIVRAVTASPDDLNATNISAFIQSEIFSFTDYSIEGRKKRSEFYTYKKPLLTEGNGGRDTDFLFRSLLMQTQPNTIQNIPPFIGVGATGNENGGRWALIHDNRVEGTRMSLMDLYELAYGDTVKHIPLMNYAGSPPVTSYGKFWEKPVLEIKDSSAFRVNDSTLEGYYNYSLSVPLKKANTPYVQKIMQQDLKNYFEFDVTVETRLMPCWNIIFTESGRKKLPAKGGNTYYEFTPTFLKTKNRTLFDVVHLLWSYHQNGPPFIDATGYPGNIDLTIHAELRNFDEVRAELLKKGLKLEMGQKEMKVIVVRDAHEIGL